ncbi:MAG: hypothetical protein FJW36_22670 [Acidobacteria bacterium]|nr:hypothetical protein [Acidobacteriota bacterium]
MQPTFDEQLNGQDLVASMGLNLAILMPVKDDWASASQLIGLIDEKLRGSNVSATAVCVDDGSILSWRDFAFPDSLSAVKEIRTVRLRRNLSHQRAIAIGLTYLQTNLEADGVLVMDSDGEDTPEGVLSLVKEY